MDTMLSNEGTSVSSILLLPFAIVQDRIVPFVVAIQSSEEVVLSRQEFESDLLSKSVFSITKLFGRPRITIPGVQKRDLDHKVLNQTSIYTIKLGDAWFWYAYNWSGVLQDMLGAFSSQVSLQCFGTDSLITSRKIFQVEAILRPNFVQLLMATAPNYLEKGWTAHFSFNVSVMNNDPPNSCCLTLWVIYSHRYRSYREWV